MLSISPGLNMLSVSPGLFHTREREGNPRGREGNTREGEGILGNERGNCIDKIPFHSLSDFGQRVKGELHLPFLSNNRA